MIPNSSLDCSFVVLNFWPNLSVLIKLFLEKKRVFYSTRTQQLRERELKSESCKLKIEKCELRKCLEVSNTFRTATKMIK